MNTPRLLLPLITLCLLTACDSTSQTPPAAAKVFVYGAVTRSGEPVDNFGVSVTTYLGDCTSAPFDSSGAQEFGANQYIASIESALPDSYGPYGCFTVRATEYSGSAEAGEVPPEVIATVSKTVEATLTPHYQPPYDSLRIDIAFPPR